VACKFALGVGVQLGEQARALAVGFVVEVGGGAQALAGAFDDASGFAEHLAGDVHASAHGLGDHRAYAGLVVAGVGDQVLAGCLQFLPALGEFSPEGAELAARSARVVRVRIDLAHEGLSRRRTQWGSRQRA
jgi:hypothetical protein